MNEISRKLMPIIDEYVEKNMNPESRDNIAKVAQPEIVRLAAENGLDEVDLLVDYLDHVSLVSKKMNCETEEKLFSEEEIARDDFKLY